MRQTVPLAVAVKLSQELSSPGVIGASLAATTGVEQGTDVAAYLLAGADVVMSASALLRHGPEYAQVLLDQLSQWMRRKHFYALAEFRGTLALDAGVDRTAIERDRYVHAMRVANVRPIPAAQAAGASSAARPGAPRS